MLKTQPCTQFKRDIKLAKKQNKDMEALKEVIDLLCKEKDLPKKYRDHDLSNNWRGYRECHINPDWLLIYRVDETHKILKLMRVGSHSNLFKK